MAPRPIEPADVPAVEAYLGDLGTALGHEPVGERKFIGLRHRPLGMLEEGEEGIVGVAPIVVHETEATLEIGADSDAVAGRLLEAVVDTRDEHRIRAWCHRGRHRRVFVGAGFRLDRVLHRLRARLPVSAVGTDGLSFRGFRPGEDEDAWLRVNNRAFEGHPEQGDLGRGDLAERMELPWWDPAGLRLGVVGDHVVGFCWTKVHPDRVGEIYVIGLDPEVAGQGWGRALTVEGLRHLHEERGCAEAILYVDGANRAAMSLYADLGFHEEHTDLAFVLDQPNRR